MSTPPRSKLKPAEFSGVEMCYIIDLLRNSSEPDKIVHRKAIIEVITRVFTAHIEKDRKPFEQYYPDHRGEVCRS